MYQLPCLVLALASTLIAGSVFLKHGLRAALPVAIFAVILWLLGLFFFVPDFGGRRVDPPDDPRP
jgi:hypothetical protein